MGADTWKDILHEKIDASWAEEIDDFESQTRLRKQAKLDEKVFAETRLRRGVYGPRYDTGKRPVCAASRSRMAAFRLNNSKCTRIFRKNIPTRFFT